MVVSAPWVYRAATAALEAELAERVHALIASQSSGRLEAQELSSAQTGGPELTDEQQTGVSNALSHRLSLITGGPGTGKTASIRTIAAAATQQGAKVMLVAPTGRAAIRMTEASGVRARTVHSALGWIPGEGPTHDEDDPLACDLLIVDESSMANLELMVTLLRAVGPSTHVVLVGDADQLAPVGAGKPFAELVSSDVVPAVALTHIFRQAAGSMIVQGAHAIRRGAVPDFTATEGMRRDLFLITRADPRAAREEIVALVSERLPAHYDVDPVSDIQVFAPVYKGELGIDALNEALREALNPHGSPVRGGRLRLGDKVMMTGRNLHELGLMNGTLLRLLDETSGGADDDDARADPGIRRDGVPAAARGGRPVAAGLRVLGASGSGNRAARRGDRRARRRRRVLPAPRDALHGGDPGQAGHSHRRHARRDRTGREDSRHRAAPLPTGRAPGGSEMTVETIAITSPGASTSASFAPSAGMVCCSLIHEGEELLDLGRGLDAYASEARRWGSRCCIPWANRLAAFSYAAAGRTVTLPEDPQLLPRTNTDCRFTVSSRT